MAAVSLTSSWTHKPKLSRSAKGSRGVTGLLRRFSEARDRLVELVSGLPSGKQETVDVMVGQPIFDAATEAMQHAYYGAIEDAHAKAAVIARASGGRVGRVLSARQMPEDRNVSGALGDESLWGGFHVGGGGRTLDADEPTRKVFVRFLVRFELIHDANIQRQSG